MQFKKNWMLNYYRIENLSDCIENKTFFEALMAVIKPTNNFNMTANNTIFFFQSFINLNDSNLAYCRYDKINMHVFTYE